MSAEGPKLDQEGIMDLKHKQVRPLHRSHNTLHTTRESTKTAERLHRACKGRDRQEHSEGGPPTPAAFISGSGDGSPRKFPTGLSHIWGTQYRKGRRPAKSNWSGRPGLDQVREGKTGMKPKLWTLKTDKPKRQTAAVRPTDTQSLSSARLPAFQPPFF